MRRHTHEITDFLLGQNEDNIEELLTTLGERGLPPTNFLIKPTRLSLVGTNLSATCSSKSSIDRSWSINYKISHEIRKLYYGDVLLAETEAHLVGGGYDYIKLTIHAEGFGQLPLSIMSGNKPIRTIELPDFEAKTGFEKIEDWKLVAEYDGTGEEEFKLLLLEAIRRGINDPAKSYLVDIICSRISHEEDKSSVRAYAKTLMEHFEARAQKRSLSPAVARFSALFSFDKPVTNTSKPELLNNTSNNPSTPQN